MWLYLFLTLASKGFFFQEGVENDHLNGQFKAKIGMSFWIWGQIVQIEVTGSDEGRSSVEVRCEALHQKYDWGRNNRMIEDFYRELKNQFQQTGT
jgi:hypothetical protein